MYLPTHQKPLLNKWKSPFWWFVDFKNIVFIKQPGAFIRYSKKHFSRENINDILIHYKMDQFLLKCERGGGDSIKENRM